MRFMKKRSTSEAVIAREESEPRVPTDLHQALAATPTTKAKWADLTPIARRDFISRLDSAKQAETRRRRIEKACSMLVAGKRRPCCYSIVSFNLYTALKATPKAKAQWSDLTPTERRDFINWMDQTKNRRHISVGSRKPARCLRPESGTPDVFQSLLVSH
jgi:uncharacterized protein YdeI (YjbR/CyaY-like superfamily)